MKHALGQCLKRAYYWFLRRTADEPMPLMIRIKPTDANRITIEVHNSGCVFDLRLPKYRQVPADPGNYVSELVRSMRYGRIRIQSLDDQGDVIDSRDIR